MSAGPGLPGAIIESGKDIQCLHPRHVPFGRLHDGAVIPDASIISWLDLGGGSVGGCGDGRHLVCLV